MYTLNCRGRLLSIDTPVVMGIINVTPDSFYGQSRAMAVNDAVDRAGKMLSEGAAILDIGGQSTRPGSAEVSAEAELDRILPVIDALAARFPEAVLSVDTYHSKVAEQAVAHGAAIINDISGGEFDEDMLAMAASLHTPFVCMHVKGGPSTMHSKTTYSDVVAEVLDYFARKMLQCREAGIVDMIIDPGFGFSKDSNDNFQLLAQLEAFSVFNSPVLIGLSRKSTVYKTLGITPAESLNGTTVLNTAALLKGASILRVHDVKEALEAVKLVSCIQQAGAFRDAGDII